MRRALPLLIPILLLPAAAAVAEVETRTGDVTWTFGAEARIRPEYRDNFDLDGGVNDDRREWFMRLRLGVGAAYKDEFRLFLQAQDARAWGEEASTTSNDKNLDLHQGYLAWRKMGVKGLSLTLGRQEWKYGEERLVGAFGWNNIGRSFDGGRLAWEHGRGFVDGLYARISNRTSATNATQGSDFASVQAQWNVRKGAQYGAYGLFLADSVPAAGETGSLDDTRIYAAGGRVKDRFGIVDLNAEAAMESGEINGDDLSAFAGAVQVGVNFGGGIKVRPFGGYDYATGDEDPADGDRGEFFNFFPTNHAHYGYMDLFGWRNLASPYLGVTFSSGRHLGTVKAHAFSLVEERGPWKDAGGNVLGSDPTGGSGKKVGSEIDVLYRFGWTEKATFEAAVARFDPDEFAEATRGEDAQYWAYASLTFGF